MNFLVLLYDALAAVCFGAWPNMTKRVISDWPWLVALVGTFSGLVGWAAIVLTKSPAPHWLTVQNLALAGLLNGLGMAFYALGFKHASAATTATLLVTLGVMVASPLSEAVLLTRGFFTPRRVLACGIVIAVGPVVQWLMQPAK